MMDFRLRPLPSALACLAVAASQAVAAPSTLPPPTFVSLEAPNDIGSTMPRRITDTGQIVGTFLDRTHNAQGFRQTHGVYVTLSLPIPKGSMLEEISVNGRGQLAGTFLDARRHPHSFLWSDDKYRVIDFPNAVYTRALECV